MVQVTNEMNTDVSIEKAVAALNEMEIMTYQDAFNVFDKDRSGSICARELKSALTVIGQHPSDDDVSRLLDDADMDGDGEIQFPEFLILLVRKKIMQTDPETEVKEAFKVFDKDGDGFISPEELKLVMKNLGEDMTNLQVKEMIEQVDADGDGQISLDEFKMMMYERAQED